MSDERKYGDSKTQEFYEKNRDMVEKILEEERARNDAHAQRHRDREDGIDSGIGEGADRAFDDYRYGRDRTMDAFDESRDAFRDFADEQSDYAFRAMREERERMRRYAEAERRCARERYDAERARIREERDRFRAHVSEDVEDLIGCFADPGFQQHLVGAGIEAFMALNSLIRAGPFPDSFKEAAERGDIDRTAAFCKKNPRCYSRNNPDRPGTCEDEPSEGTVHQPQKIVITPATKTGDGPKKKT